MNNIYPLFPICSVCSQISDFFLKMSVAFIVNFQKIIIWRYISAIGIHSILNIIEKKKLCALLALGNISFHFIYSIQTMIWLSIDNKHAGFTHVQKSRYKCRLEENSTITQSIVIFLDNFNIIDLHLILIEYCHKH